MYILSWAQACILRIIFQTEIKWLAASASQGLILNVYVTDCVSHDGKLVHILLSRHTRWFTISPSQNIRVAQPSVPIFDHMMLNYRILIRKFWLKK